jgi:hypothetical protein
MKKYIRVLALIASVSSFQLFAATDVVNKKTNERYTNNPELHQKVENTRGNSDGFYEHPNNQQHEADVNSTKSQVKSDASDKVQNSMQQTTNH